MGKVDQQGGEETIGDSIEIGDGCFGECMLRAPVVSNVEVIGFYYGEEFDEGREIAPNASANHGARKAWDEEKDGMIKGFEAPRHNCSKKGCECVPYEGARANTRTTRAVSRVRKKKFAQKVEGSTVWVKFKYEVKYTIEDGFCVDGQGEV